MTTVEIISFGYGHAAPPEAHLILDLRKHFRDPHVNPALRYMTAEDRAVRRAVLGVVTGRQRWLTALLGGFGAAVLRLSCDIGT